MNPEAIPSTQKLAKLSLILCVLAALLTFGDWLALHDIRHDYVSRDVIVSSLGDWDERIPEWSKTPAEWKTVEISAFIRIPCFAVCTFTLVTILKRHDASRGNHA